MENNNKIRDLYELYIELGHDAFEEKIKKPMEACLHDGSNGITINSLNTIIANAMEKSKLGEAGCDEYDIFSHPSFKEEICFDNTLPPIYDDYNHCDIFSPPTIEDIVYVDYDMPPIYDVYNDEYDIFSPSTIEDKIHYDYSMPPIYDDYNDGCDTFTPTITNETVYAYVESNDTFMHVDHDKNALCDSYIVEFIHDATENYFERGKYGYRNLHVTKFLLFMMKVLSFLLICFYLLGTLRPTGPYERGRHDFIYHNNIKSSLFMLKFLKLHLFCISMLVTLFFIDLFSYKTPMHRKSVRFKHVLYMLLDALFYVSTLIFMWAS